MLAKGTAISTIQPESVMRPLDSKIMSYLMSSPFADEKSRSPGMP